jgi:hypothetical protein
MATSPGAASWLFIKGQDTIWLLRADPDHLVVCGPGTCREHFRFDADSAMESFQVSFAERLIAGGWILWGIDRERRSGHDRRGATRKTTDRRSPPPAVEEELPEAGWN